MNKYDFILTPAYCLFNGVGIFEQKRCYIKFLIQDINDEILKERIRRAFINYLSNIKKNKECEKLFIGNPVVEFSKASRDDIRKYVSSLYACEDKNNYSQEIHIKSKNEDAAAILLLDRLLTDGRAKNATDIHIEDKSIRFRIKGSLVHQMSISGKRYKELVQRVKLLCGMNVLEKKKSQDGHFVYGGKNPLFIRASSVYLINDSYEGEESIVLRLLDTSRIPLCIDKLGFNENQLEQISEMENLHHGLIIVCGPTGSGKSTTIASILVELVKKYNGSLKIISVEDPPEYVIPGVSQIKIENDTNNYHDTVNHIFRLDPDVIMIGEIRDEVSAAVALKASLTGHLVFATLHTGSVSESILRLENLGVNRNFLCSVLKGVICQELSFVGEEIKLYADIGIPIENFSKKIQKEMGEDEIEQLFIHETNYSELLTRTLEIFSKRDSQLIKKEKRNHRIWKEEKNGNVYKRIV